MVDATTAQPSRFSHPGRRAVWGETRRGFRVVRAGALVSGRTVR